MIVRPSAALPELLLFEPRIFRDTRGDFRELFNADRYAEAGLAERFVQDNLSRSHRHVLRGLHVQHPRSQGKLVCVLEGTVFDVSVDIRIGSPTFGRWAGVTLDAERGEQLWIPPGFAHGFVVLSERASFCYKCTEPYVPANELSIRWDDPAIGIEWPVDDPTVSDRDADAPLLGDYTPDRLPHWSPAAP